MSTESQKTDLEAVASRELLAAGWREYHNQFKTHARCFYKHFKTPTRCHCNSDKPGMQIELAISRGAGCENYELELSGELSDGTWIRILNYAMPDEFKRAVSLIPRMLALWEAAND